MNRRVCLLIFKSVSSDVFRINNSRHLKTLCKSLESPTILFVKKAGDAVKMDEVVVEIETDKTAIPVMSPGNGVITKMYVKDGEAVKSQQVLFQVDVTSTTPAASAPAAPAAPAPAAAAPAAAPAAPPPPPPAAAPVGGATEDVKAPNFPDSISTGDVKFVKKAGDAVKMDEVVVEIETDKTAIPVMSPGNGVITKMYVKDGEAVKSQQVLFQVSVSSSTPSAPAAAAPAAAAAAPPPPTAAAAPAAPAATAAPVAVKVAVAAKPKAAAKAAGPPGQGGGARTETAVKMNKMRLRIAQRLKEAQNTAAMLTTFNEIDMSKIIAFRKSVMESFQKKYGVRMSFMSPFIKACVNALLDQPVVNAVIEGDSIVYRDYVDISFAAATPRGLVVPVIRNAEGMNFAQIELAMNELATKARDGKLSARDMVGGTFTISNGGVFGSLLSAPIINPPQSAILGMHATFQRPVAEQGQVVIRPMMYVALTYDHRIIDGREAVTFLRKIKSGVEDPTTILAGV